ncbi:MAG TPA: metallophosphoesterase [Solirubrobacteraceae bacterium]|nr:metallophosphoesterase [Solirubrobacteraceae bacterium]
MPEHRNGGRTSCLRIAAAGDMHCSESRRDEIRRSVSALNGVADVVLLAGDLTTHGEPEQGQVLADACAALEVPVYAVLGNHDWHANRHDELVAVLESGGIRLLDRAWQICETGGLQVGIVGLKGFVGGFPGSHLPDFGEPLLREVYHETTLDVRALDRGLREVAMCPARIVLLHYAPSEQTIEGEPPGIWGYLGTDRLAPPIAEHEPDLVLHGHAHAGTFEGAIGKVPVYNVSVPVIGRDFWLFELDIPSPAHAPIH